MKLKVNVLTYVNVINKQLVDISTEMLFGPDNNNNNNNNRNKNNNN